MSNGTEYHLKAMAEAKERKAKLADERFAYIVKLHLEGCTYQQIAARVRLSADHLRRLLQRSGLTPHNGGAVPNTVW